VFHALSLLLDEPKQESREERVARMTRVARVMAAKGMEVVVGVLARQGRGSVPLHRFALQMLSKVCVTDANYRELVKLGGVKEMAQNVSRYPEEVAAVSCLNVLQRVYCRGSAKSGGLLFADMEAVVKAMERHGENRFVQQSGCAIVGMFFRCVREGAGDSSAAGAEWCMRAVLASMQRKLDSAPVLGDGCKSLLRFMALRESQDELLGGIAAVLAGGGGDLALGALRTHESRPDSSLMRGHAFAVLSVLCHCSANKTPTALDGGVKHALDSLRSMCGEAETCAALDFLARLVCGNEQTAAEIVIRGGIQAALNSLAKGAAVGVGARSLTERACAVLVALTKTDPACESFALMGGIGVVVLAMKVYRETSLLEGLVLLLHRVSQIEGLRTSIATAGGVQAVLAFVGLEVEPDSEYSLGSTLHYVTANLLRNLAQESSLLELLKEVALGWIEAVLGRGVAISEGSRMQYESVAETLRGIQPAEVACPYCGEGVRGLDAFECHMQGHLSGEIIVVPVCFWTRETRDSGSDSESPRDTETPRESTVKIDDLGAPLLAQVLDKLRGNKAWSVRLPWGTFPETGVRVYLGDETRFLLTELDASATLRGIRAQGGVHVREGVVQKMDGALRIHVFGYAEAGEPVYTEREKKGLW
jgi:hypothetical protein